MPGPRSVGSADQSLVNIQLNSPQNAVLFLTDAGRFDQKTVQLIEAALRDQIGPASQNHFDDLVRRSLENPSATRNEMAEYLLRSTELDSRLAFQISVLSSQYNHLVPTVPQGVSDPEFISGVQDFMSRFAPLQREFRRDWSEEHELKGSLKERQELQKALIQGTGLVDGVEWSEQTGSVRGRAISYTSYVSTSGPLNNLNVASVDVYELIPEVVFRNPSALNSMLKHFFTERELNQDNLGAYKSQNAGKFRSRIAGLLSLKVATFRSAGLTLPGEEGAKSSWHDVEYAREAFNDKDGRGRFRRIRNYSGELGEALKGKGVFASFTDEGHTGMAFVMVEEHYGASGISSIGFDLTNLGIWGGDLRAAFGHASGEAIYKATYFGGHQSFYLDNVLLDLHPQGEVGSGRVSFKVSGLTERAMKRLGGESVEGSFSKAGSLMASLMIVKGKRIDELKAQPIAAPNDIKPALARQMESGEINLILQFPGQGSDFSGYLTSKYVSSPVARRVMNRLGPLIFRVLRELDPSFQYTVEDFLKGDVIPSEKLMTAAISFPMIGLAQAVAISELREAGYDFTKATALIGHSQGQIAGLYALGLLTDEEFVSYLARSGHLMQLADPFYPAETGDEFTHFDLVNSDSTETLLERIKDYHGSIPMFAALGEFTLEELKSIIAEVNAELADGTEFPEFASISLMNQLPASRYPDLLPEGIDFSIQENRNNVLVSGTTEAMKLVMQRFMGVQGKKRSIIVPPITAAYHSQAMESGLRTMLTVVAQSGKTLDEIPVPMLSNYDGSSINDLEGTVEFLGDDGQTYHIDAKIHRILADLYTGAVDWPSTLLSALAQGNPNVPTVVLDGGPGRTGANWGNGILKDNHEQPIVTFVPYGMESGEALALVGDLPADLRLVDPKDLRDPNSRPVVSQVNSGKPYGEDFDYQGSHAFFADLRLSDPVARREFIQAVEEILHLNEGGDPYTYSPALASLGYDPRMPLVLSAMTGNTKAELSSELAAERYLGMWAVATMGFDMGDVRLELERIDDLTKVRVAAMNKALGISTEGFIFEDLATAYLKKYGSEEILETYKKFDPTINKDRVSSLLAEIEAYYIERAQAGTLQAPDTSKAFTFGVNVIHDPRKLKGLEAQLKVFHKAIDDGIPINFMTVAFSDYVDYNAYKEYYIPLMEKGVAVMFLAAGESVLEQHFNDLYEETPAHLKHLFLLAPEGAEGGGHVPVENSPSTRWGYQLTRFLNSERGKKIKEKVALFMTGGQADPLANADARLTGTQASQVGSIMQLSRWSSPPLQVRQYFAEAAAGLRPFIQGQSEWERALNMVENGFALDLSELSDVLARVTSTGEGKDRVFNNVGPELAKEVTAILLREPMQQRRVLHSFWAPNMNGFNRAALTPILENVWPKWLAAEDPSNPVTTKALEDAVANMKPGDVISLYRTYRTWAIGHPDTLADRVYLLGGRSIRRMGQALVAEEMAKNPGKTIDEVLAAQKYLDMPANEIFRDLHARSMDFMLGVYQRATALEEASRKQFKPLSIEALSGIDGIEAFEPQVEGENTVLRFGVNHSDGADQWIAALGQSGFGVLARTIRTQKIEGVSDSNPLHRTLFPQAGETIELVRGKSPEGVLLLKEIRIHDQDGLRVKLSLEGNETAHETWFLPIPGEASAPVTYAYKLEGNRYGGKRMVQLAHYRDNDGQERTTLDDGRDAYRRLWVGEGVEPMPNLTDEAESQPFEVTQARILDWNKQIGLSSRVYRHPTNARVHKTMPLMVAWQSMMRAGLHPDAGIDFLSVLHVGQSGKMVNGQSARYLTSVKKGDVLTAKTKITSIIDDGSGRNIRMFTQVFNQDHALVAEYETPFLSRNKNLQSAQILKQDFESQLNPNTGRFEVKSLELYRSPKAVTVSRAGILGYSLDAQWLHSLRKFAYRMDSEGSFGGDIIAQGWLLKHLAAHQIESGYLKNKSDRFVGFNNVTVTKPVPPGTQLEFTLTRTAIQNGREIAQVQFADDNGEVYLIGEAEFSLPQNVGVFPGNASQAPGMAKALYEEGGLGKEILERGTSVLPNGELLLDVITGGVSIPEGDKKRKAAYETAIHADVNWLNSVVHSSPAVLITSYAYYQDRISKGLPVPSIVSGHSLGQYTAALVSGALKLEEAVPLVVKRGELMLKHAPGRIVAILQRTPIDGERLQFHIDRILQALPEGTVLEIANINNDNEWVIAGDTIAAQAAKKYFDDLGQGKDNNDPDKYKAIVLGANIAFHSSRVKGMEAEFRSYIASHVSIKDPKIPIASIVHPGERVTDAAGVLEELVTLNHSAVKWQDNSRSWKNDLSDLGTVLEHGGSVISPFNSKNLATLTNPQDGSRPLIISQNNANTKLAEVDVLFLGPRESKIKVAPKAKLDTPVEEKTSVEPAPVVTVPVMPSMPVQSASAAIKPLDQIGMLALDMRLGTALVNLEGNKVDSVVLSPLAPSRLEVSPRELIWYALVTSAADLYGSKIKPGDLTPSSTLTGDLALSSTEVLNVYSLARYRLGIPDIPKNNEVKDRVESHDLATMADLLVEYWGHGGDPEYDIRQGTLPKVAEPGKTYAEILRDAKISGRSAHKLIGDGKIKPEVEGYDLLVSEILKPVGEAGLDNLPSLLSALEAWQYPADIKTAGERWFNVRQVLYGEVQQIWQAERSERSAAGSQMMSMMPSMAMQRGAQTVGMSEDDARRVFHELMAQRLGQDGIDMGSVQFEDGRFVLPNPGVESAKELDRTRMIDELGTDYYEMVSNEWDGLIHRPWAEVEMNGSPRNLFRIFVWVKEDRINFETESGNARLIHLANQMDQQRINMAYDYAKVAEEQMATADAKDLPGLERARDTMLRLGDLAKISILSEKIQAKHGVRIFLRDNLKTDFYHQGLDLKKIIDHLQAIYDDDYAFGNGLGRRHSYTHHLSGTSRKDEMLYVSIDNRLIENWIAANEEKGQRTTELTGGLPQPAVWDTQTARGMEPTAYVDFLENNDAVDPQTIASMREALAGKVSFKGKKVMVYGGTGTISASTVKFFLQMGADVWFTTRRNFGDIEAWAERMRSENAVRGASLRVATNFTPSKKNISALADAQKGEQWLPDIIINGMAASDYGSITRDTKHSYVTWVLGGALDYAVGRYIERIEEEGIQDHTITIHNQASPNTNFAFGLDGSYSAAKASMPPKQWQHRRQSENAFYKSGVPLYREVSVDTGLVVRSKEGGEEITAQFAGKARYRIEPQSRDEGSPVTIFYPEEFGLINVAAHNPNGISYQGAKPGKFDYDAMDRTDVRADGGMRRAELTVDGGLKGIVSRSEKRELEGMPAANPLWNKKVEEVPFHPVSQGLLRAPTDFAFIIDEIDGEKVAPEQKGIREDGIYLVGMDMATSHGIDGKTSFINLLERRGHFSGPWGRYSGLYWLARAAGHDVDGKTGAEIRASLGDEIYANMGHRRLVERDTGETAELYETQEVYYEEDIVYLATWEDAQAFNKKPTDKKWSKLKGQVDRYAGLSGYELRRREMDVEQDGVPTRVEALVAYNPKVKKTRTVMKPAAAQIWSSMVPFDLGILGAEDVVIDQNAYQIGLGQLVASQAARWTGMSPREINEVFGKENIRVVGSGGLPGMNTLKQLFQRPKQDEAPPQKSSQQGIGGAMGGQIASKVFGATGGVKDTPHACDTGPCSLDEGVARFERRWKEYRDAVKNIDTIKQEIHAARGTDRYAVLQVQLASAQLEARIKHERAKKTFVSVTTGDWAEAVEIGDTFTTIGAMASYEDAAKLGYPDDKQNRAHDKGKTEKFQAGTGFGSFIFVTGAMLQELGLIPIAEVKASDIGSDGSPKEPNGKTRDDIGIGKWGQRKVFYEGFEQAEAKGLPIEYIRFMNSHSTGTGSDGTQTESFQVAYFSYKINKAVRVLHHANERYSTKIYPKTIEFLKNQGIIKSDKSMREDLATLADLSIQTSKPGEYPPVEQVITGLGLNIEDPKKFIDEIRAWDPELRHELGIRLGINESHAKSAGFGHTLGGTSVELVSAIYQAVTGYTLPHPYLNNIIDETGTSVLSQTFREVTSVNDVYGKRANYTTTPDKLPHAYGVAQNSFGFNGLDGFNIFEITQTLRFKTKKEATEYFTKAVQTYVKALALVRAKEKGDHKAITFIESAESAPLDHPGYEDLKTVYDQAEMWAGKIVRREYIWSKILNPEAHGYENVVDIRHGHSLRNQTVGTADLLPDDAPIAELGDFASAWRQDPETALRNLGLDQSQIDRVVRVAGGLDLLAANPDLAAVQLRAFGTERTNAAAEVLENKRAFEDAKAIGK